MLYILKNKKNFFLMILCEYKMNIKNNIYVYLK